MSDKICGYPTQGGDGPPCQHPPTDDGDPDRCYIDAHNDADTGNDTPGRDFAIDESDHAEILNAAKKGVSKTGCARAAGASRTSLERYLDAHDQFRAEFARARARGEQRLATGPLMESEDGEPAMDGQHARFLLSTSFGYQKTEKKEIENTGDEPLSEVVVDFTDVDT